MDHIFQLRLGPDVITNAKEFFKQITDMYVLSIEPHLWNLNYLGRLWSFCMASRQYVTTFSTKHQTLSSSSISSFLVKVSGSHSEVQHTRTTAL